MLGAIGEFERDLIKERAAEGIARAKAKGVKFGSDFKLTDDETDRLREEAAKAHLTKSDLARKYGISRSTLYRVINRGATP